MNSLLHRLHPSMSEPAGSARSQAVFTTLAPRLLWRTGTALALGMAAVSCVPATQYEEARSAAQVEMDGRRRAEHRVAEAEHEREKLRAELARRDDALKEREQAIDESKLQTSVAAKERDQASQLVEQLRGELARVGDHMRVFSDQKRDLEQALSNVDAARKAELDKDAERSALRTRLMRDLTLLLHDPIAGGEYGLDVREGELTLRVADPKLLNEAGTVSPERAALFKALVRASELYPAVKLELAERDPGSGVSVATSSARLEAVRKALADGGVASDRLLLPAAAAPNEGAPPSSAVGPAPELEIRFVFR